MKKFFLSAVMAIAALTASAEQPVGGISLTPHFGLGYAIASPSLGDTYDGFITAVAGVEATYKATDLLGVSLGLDYGFCQTPKEVEKNDEGKAECYLSHYTLSIPVLAQVHFGQFAIKAGIQPGWIISPKGHLDGSSKDVTISSDVKGDDQVNSFQLSIPVGISYSPSFPLQFDLRYSLPLSNYFTDSAMKEAKAMKYNFENSKLGTIMLTVGYRFDLGR